MLLDISELKQAEDKARKSDQRYRLIAENSTDIIVTSTIAGIATFVSPSCKVATGYTSEEIVGEYVLKRAHPDDLAHVVAAFRSLAAGNPVSRVRWRSSHKTEDRWVWLESSPALVRDPATQTASFLNVVRDVTVQKEQEDALAAARIEAEEAMHSKAHFLANMSHELRTPLNSIIGFSRLLNESATLDPEDQRRIRMVHSAGLALHAVIDNVLDFSKLEADKLALHCTPFDVPDFFTSTIALLEPQAATRDVRLHVAVDPRLPAGLIGDSGRLRQILLNLLSNAVKFTHDGSVSTSVILVNQEGGAARLRVEVADTGLGIPEDKLPALFNRFVQASASVAPQYGGTGLGLAIARQLVSLMGGEIGVSSELGKGSTFWFEISLPLAPVQKGDAEVVAPSILSLSGKRILVVDDVDLNRELMIAMLSRYDCEVVLAEDGVGALAALEAQRFDLVLMDCQMPVMDGFAATREIRKQTGPAATMPIIALTASAEPEHLERCRQAGMDEYLTKPLDPRALEGLLARYLGDGGAVTVSASEKPAVHKEEAAAIPLALASTEGTARAAGGSLRARYDARRTAMLEALDAMIRSGRFTEREVSEVNIMAHNLAGTAGMFGEADLGNVAAALDTGLGQWRPDERPERIREAFDTMCAAISA